MVKNKLSKIFLSLVFSFFVSLFIKQNVLACAIDSDCSGCSDATCVGYSKRLVSCFTSRTCSCIGYDCGLICYSNPKATCTCYCREGYVTVLGTCYYPSSCYFSSECWNDDWSGWSSCINGQKYRTCQSGYYLIEWKGCSEGDEDGGGEADEIPEIEGIYFAEGQIYTGEGDSQLHVRGSLV